MNAMLRVFSFLAPTLIAASALAQAQVSQELWEYFTPEEIAAYQAASGGVGRATVPQEVICNGDVCVLIQALQTNRLTDEGHNRCGDDELPVEECPLALDAAWQDGNGCITETEYNYALDNAIAPICKPFSPTEYLGWCRCGCFEKTTTLRATDLMLGTTGDVPVTEIGVDSHEVLAFTETASLSRPSYAARRLNATTVGAEEKPLVWLHLSNGVALGLTTQHAVLLRSGQMVTAESIEAGAELVDELGAAVTVVDVQRKATSDKVYNVLTDAGKSHKGHMIIANGVIVGDIMWQNTLATDLWEIVLRM